MENMKILRKEAKRLESIGTDLLIITCIGEVVLIVVPIEPIAFHTSLMIVVFLVMAGVAKMLYSIADRKTAIYDRLMIDRLHQSVLERQGQRR